MNSKSYPAYRYVVLVVFMLITVAIEIQWLTHAAVARPAEVFYKGQFNPDSFFNIDFLAMVYMLIFLIFSFPASYIIDTYGIRKALITGSVLLATFSLLKAVFANNFNIVVLSQTGLAIAQPFILNAVTALTVRWFPLTERGMAAGLSALAQYIGIIIAMLVTPALVGSNPDLPGYGEGFQGMLYIYAGISVLFSLLCIIFIRERPAGMKADDIERIPFFDGLKHILKKKDMILVIILFLIGLGMFNAISSMTDSLAENVGVRDSDGLIGGLMLIGGIIGAIILPTLSDKFRKRKLFIIICIVGMLPGVLGLSFPDRLSDNPESIYTIALIASFILGFFVMSAGPIGFQYAAEVSSPAPESASQGILLWTGQISGMLFVAGMSVESNKYLDEFLVGFSILSLIAIILVFMLKESPVIRIQGDETV